MGYYSNPVNSFLQGFAAVDRLETNKLNRDIAKENQSRVRKLWQRQDDEYEYAKLERYRTNKLAEFDGIMADLITNDDGSPTDLADPMRYINEAVKRMQATDPQFGEHVGLALGHDPADSPFIKDPQQPVTGIGLHPDYGGFLELGTTNGRQPLTELRSARADDKVAFRKIGMQELVKIFGPEIWGSRYAAAKFMRDFVGGNQITGNPTQTQDQKQQSQDKKPGLFDADYLPEAESSEPPPVNTYDTDVANTEYDEGIAPENQPETRPRSEFSERELYDLDLRETAFGKGDTPLSSRVSAGIKLAISNLDYLTFGVRGHGDDDTFVDAAVETAQEGVAYGIHNNRGRQYIDKTAGFVADVVYELATGKPSPTQGQGIDAKVRGDSGKGELDDIVGPDHHVMEPGTKRTTEPVNTTKDVANVTNGSTKDYQADNFTTPNKGAARTVLKTPVPGSAAAAQGAANNVLTTSKRPSFAQMFNAVSLAKMGMISADQLMNYAQTGSVNKPTERKLQAVHSGNWARAFDPQTGEFGQAVQIAPGGEGNDEDRFDLLMKYTSDFFIDDKGKVDKYAARDAVRRLDRSLDVLANRFNDGNPIPIDQSFVNDFEDGMRMVRAYEDPRGTFSPSNWFDGRKLNDRSGLIGYIAVQKDIVNQNEFDDFAFNFGIELTEFANRHGWSDERLAHQILILEDGHKADGISRKAALAKLIKMYPGS